MRNLLVWIAVGLSSITVLTGQQAEDRQTSEAIQIEQMDKHRNILKDYQAQENYYLPITFNSLPDKGLQQRLTDAGVELITYQQKATYLAKIPKGLSAQELQELGIIKVEIPNAKEKIAPDILQQSAPEWAIPQAGWLDIAIGLQSAKSAASTATLVERLGGEFLNQDLNKGQIQLARIPVGKIDELAKSPLVQFIDVMQEPDQALNHELRTIQRVNVLNKGYNGIPGLNGEGVAIGIGDGGQLGDHIDFDNRVINVANGTYSSFGSHGDHVAGIVGGAGHIDPRNRGVASKATLITQKTSLITYYAEDYYNDYGMVLTNNSYGTSFNCANNGTYNYSSLTLDKQLLDLPELLHVFAAGNSGGNSCPDYPQGYRTVLRYYQAAKNVLTVGNTNKDRSIRGNSSRGPVADGRIKPEIVGVGSNIVSTGRDYNYFSASGTSMAAPAVTATLSLLYERYRQLHGGTNPKSDLVKAIACNTATDLGTAGPDYIFGFGLINGRRAVDVLNNRQYRSGALNTGEQITHSISVPANTKRVKIMLYWHDKEGVAFGPKALVNDLDLSVVAPSNGTYLPWVLDHDPAKVDYPATRKVDTLNNIEQVTIDNPTAGNYEVVVDGSEIPFGAQSYVIVYDFIPEELMMTYPSGGETFIPGSEEYVQWDADITNEEEFNLEYSEDNGQTWNSLSSGIGEDERHFVWTVPDITTQQGLIRISKTNGSGGSSQNTLPFTILQAPKSLEATPYCNKLVGLKWHSVPGNDIAYEVSIFDGEQMKVLTTLTDTSYIVREDLTVGEKYWFSVNTVLSAGGKSQRTVATFCVPDPNELCPWRNDPQFLNAQVTERGRFNTFYSLAPDEDVSIVVRNVGINTLDSVLVTYQINNLPPVSEWVIEQVPSGDTLFYTFNQKADLSEVGTYRINTWVDMPEDEHQTNDSLMNEVVSIQLANEQVELPIGGDFNQAEERTYSDRTLGLDGASKLDFDLWNNGKLVVQEDAFYLMPADQTDTSQITNDLILTVDLSDYNTYQGIIVLNFDHYSLETGVGPLSAVKRVPSTVWIRGSDSDEWVEVMTLVNEAEWNSVEHIKIKDILANAGQKMKASTQIKFRQEDSFGLAISNLKIEDLTALPVDWLNFQAQVTDSGPVILEWTTDNEEENDFFEVKAAYMEKGKEGIPVYHTIARVKSAGNSPGVRNYSFIDPHKFAERIHYKITQVDYDGNSSDSPIRIVEINQPNKAAVAIYPNPFDEHINITANPTQGTIHSIRLVDAQGRVHLTKENTSDNRNFELFLPELPVGYYFLELFGENGPSRHKIVKR